MKKIEIKYNNEENTNYGNYIFIDLLYEYDIRNTKKFFYVLFIIFFSIVIINIQLYSKNMIDLTKYKKFVRDCKSFIRYDRNKIYSKIPYFAICLSALNMENYIEKNLLSIINQSFQDFEIIIINDKSIDETENIIKRIQLEDDRIKIISHSKNLGVYRSRIESILNSQSKYILLMDPDDMYMNENLLKELYDYNLNYNIDIIEFIVFQQFDGKNKIFSPNNPFETHYHHFQKNIIFQPELSEILYYIPGTKEYSHTICRNIWNKMIRREIFIKTYKYIGKEYYNDFVITADDMIMNVISYQFAENYTNINIPGYLYIIRKISMSRGDGGKELMQIRALNHFSYFKIFYKYLKDYRKDRNFLYYEMKDLNRFILYLKESDNIQYKLNEINFIKQMMKDKLISEEFKSHLNNLLLFFQNK